VLAPSRKVKVRTRKGKSRNPKRGEPQDRQRGATNPQGFRRSKPSRRRETVKVERDLSRGKDGPKHRRNVKATSQERGAGVDAEADVDGEAIFEKPKRGA
jgi:hypothetical protein